MQNKANFRKSQVNVKYYNTVDYVKWTLGERGKNKANSNPIQTQYKANSKPKQTQYKPKTNPIYRGVASREAETNPISDGGRFFSIDRPFTSGLTVHALLVIVGSFLSIAEWIGMLDCVFSDLRR